MEPGFGGSEHGIPEPGLRDGAGRLQAGTRRHYMKDADAESVLGQVDVEPPDLAFCWCRARLQADGSTREDRDSIPVAGRVGRLAIRQSPLLHGGAEGRAGRGAVLRHRDHVGVVRGDFLNDARDASAASVLDVPGEEPHYLNSLRYLRFVVPSERADHAHFSTNSIS